MSDPVMKSSLSSQRQRLLELCQRAFFGRVEELRVCDMQPVLDPLPRVVREYKIPGENKPRGEWLASEFALKAQWIELFQLFDEMQNGIIEMLEFKHGLPFRVFVAEGAV
jgi:hypothetical protein